MSILRLAFLMAALWIVPAQAQNVVGEWLGVLKAGPNELHVAVHVTKDQRGALHGTMDSVDQGAKGLAISSITLSGTQLSFTLDVAQARYEGTVSADGNTIEGTWTQGQRVPLTLKRTAAKPRGPVKPSDIDGDWLGTLDVGTLRLRLVFHIVNTADGLAATADSIDQGAKGIPVNSVTRDGVSLRMVLPSIDATFEGEIAKDVKSISGKFAQRGVPLALTLTRVKDPAELERRRPQDPVRPFPYREEEVIYDNKSAGVKLAATFTTPLGKGPFPAVLLITGSGAQDRDESLLGHKPFLVLSDYLTRKGIAVLRADDRGTAKSTGNFATATTADFATDTEAGLAWLKTRPDVDAHRIGLIGHSEGGTIAAMVAARNHDVDFIVMLAGPGVRGDEILPAQVSAETEAAGQSHDYALQAGALERDILKVVEQEPDPAALRKKLEAYLPKDQLDQQLPALNSPWFRYFLTYDPTVDLRKLTVSVLALNGSKDTQVPATQNLPVIRKALEEAGNKHFETVEMPGLNHLFQTAKTGAVSEYATLDETMSPSVMEKVAAWILAR